MKLRRLSTVNEIDINSNMIVLKVQEQIMFELYTCEKNGHPNSLNDYRSARVFY